MRLLLLSHSLPLAALGQQCLLRLLTPVIQAVYPYHPWNTHTLAFVGTMTVDLYYTPASAACRSVMLTAKAVELELNLKPIDLRAKEQMKEEFIALNPQHCVPTLVDDDFILWESRAICTYLATQYGKLDALYPSEPKARATVDRLLYFDLGTLYHRFEQYVYPVMFGGQEKAEPKKLKELQEALAWLNDFLAGHDWAAGNNITVADNVLVATVSTVEAAGIDLSEHDNVTSWLEKCKATLPGYTEVNEPGAAEFGNMAKEKLCTVEEKLADAMSTNIYGSD